MAKLGFIGSGNMAEAIVKGVLTAKYCLADQIQLMDVNADRLAQLQKMFHVKTTQDMSELVQNAECVIWAVKPQVAPGLIEQLQATWPKGTLAVSIMAGISLFQLAHLGASVPVIRVMPNTPAMVGQGMSAFCGNACVQTGHKEMVEKIFSSVGKVLEVGEDKMDSVTAVSGSGPAYVYYFAEVFIDAAIKQGLAREQAQLLVKQTLLGAAQMMMSCSEQPEELRAKVSSPGGTTLAGLDCLTKGDLIELMAKTVAAARLRSQELGG